MCSIVFSFSTALQMYVAGGNRYIRSDQSALEAPEPPQPVYSQLPVPYSPQQSSGKPQPQLAAAAAAANLTRQQGALHKERSFSCQ